MTSVTFETPVWRPTATLQHSYLLLYRKLVNFFCAEHGRGKILYAKFWHSIQKFSLGLSGRDVALTTHPIHRRS
jgi:hypothetical protein